MVKLYLQRFFTVFFTVLSLGLAGMMTIGADGCDNPQSDKTTSASGVKQATVAVKTQANGLTIEQQNISDRLKKDNEVGAIKHLYVVSTYSGQVLIYSTVRGKVTSGGKRLTPTTVSAIGNASDHHGSLIPVWIGGDSYRTTEVLQDDGTYGTSDPYIYWWDTRGIYHQHFISGGQIIHISDQPLSVKSIVINMELK